MPKGKKSPKSRTPKKQSTSSDKQKSSKKKVPENEPSTTTTTTTVEEVPKGIFIFWTKLKYLDFSPSLKLEQILTQYIGEDYIQKVQKINVDEIKEGNLFYLILLTI